jgi:hypothetical protein
MWAQDPTTDKFLGQQRGGIGVIRFDTETGAWHFLCASRPRQGLNSEPLLSWQASS